MAVTYVVMFVGWLLLVIAFWWTYAPQKTIAQMLHELEDPTGHVRRRILAVYSLSSDASGTRPDKCPECGSTAVGTLAKEITAATYWRCHRCGHVWNPGRDRANQRSNRWRL